MSKDCDNPIPTLGETLDATINSIFGSDDPWSQYNANHCPDDEKSQEDQVSNSSFWD